MLKKQSVLRYIFISVLLCMCSVLILSQWTWLEMRINIAIIVPLLYAITFLLFRYLHIVKRYWFIFTFQVMILALYLYVYEFDSGALLFMPALHFKELLYLSVSIDFANILLLVMMMVGNITSLRLSLKGE